MVESIFSKFTEPTFLVAFLASFIVPCAVYAVQQQSRSSQFFHECAKSLFSENPVEQSTAAILLRGFLKRPRWKFLFNPNYTKETKNLMVVLLRNSISVNLQKIIADGFSYADCLNGQDMQYINMVNASIKPKYRIKYEQSGSIYYKNKRIPMQKADFFHAILQECSINNVNAKGAIFFCSILCGTSFKNCILEGANFENANVRKVKFDADCKLEGASFKGAVGIDSASVEIANDSNMHSLIEFIDKEGVFHSKSVPVDERYVIDDEKLNVFVSKLGSMDSQQQMQYDSAIATLMKLEEVEIQKIDREQYLSVSQLTDVETHLEKCDGCVIFAFEYLNVDSGYIHKNVEGKDRKKIDNQAFPSPWLHIEAAMANGKQMPCLIIYDSSLCRDGMFDDMIIQSDKNMFSIPYSDNLSLMDKTVLQKWMGAVREHHYNKKFRRK